LTNLSKIPEKNQGVLDKIYLHLRHKTAIRDYKSMQNQF